VLIIHYLPPINLIAEGTLGKGYELGNICSKYYSLDDSFDDSELLNDLRNFIGIYKELKGYIGLDILNLKNNLTEDDYQKKSQEVKRKDLEKGPIKRKTKTINTVVNTWFRDPGISKAALENANFLCEFDFQHNTFISSATGKQFVEAHHLIPMQFQNNFDVSIDVPENIISLCPNCHRAFHNAEEKVKNIYIQYFFGLRENLLKTRDLNIIEKDLIDMYK
jgi:5-methylcytosine-specific restriction protein A